MIDSQPLRVLRTMSEDRSYDPAARSVMRAVCEEWRAHADRATAFEAVIEDLRAQNARLRKDETFARAVAEDRVGRDLKYSFEAEKVRLRRESAEIRSALEDLLKMHSHCGSCCVTVSPGVVAVLPDTCCCAPEVKRALAALATTEEEKAAWLGPRRKFDPEDMGR